ncbi:hypothetical protein SEA_MRMIYAGI_39 [Mycobacterium phage MrMiyagi]|uniref:Uncharacterized protein n=1 Tax=Mycobacterium phage MrMiyagi TaxID=2762395 RepID=A0A7G8LPT1_9CAUD|nr:hypothetical protein SEA_MRMIYAGI_39 [Mycobacterium phage MrMiyagi]
MNNSYRGLRVFPIENPEIYSGNRKDRQGQPVPSGTIKGCNGLGSAYIKWDNGNETLIQLNKVETYGQYDSSRLS